MSPVRLNRAVAATALRIEFPNQSRIARPCNRRSDPFYSVCPPDAVQPAEGRQPAFRAGARAGEDEKAIFGFDLNHGRRLDSKARRVLAVIRSLSIHSRLNQSPFGERTHTPKT